MRLTTIGAVWTFATLAIISSVSPREAEELYSLYDDPQLYQRPSKTIKVFIEAPPPDPSPKVLVVEEQNSILDTEQGRPRGGRGGGGGRSGPRPVLGSGSNHLGSGQNHAGSGGLSNLGGIGNMGKAPNNPLASLLANPFQSLLPTQLGSFLAKPAPTPIPRPVGGLEGVIPFPLTTGLPPPRGGGPRLPPVKLPNQGPHLPNIPNIIPIGKQPRPPAQPYPVQPYPYKENRPPKSSRPGQDAQCTQQQISCNFVREAAYQMQNDDDECLKLATSFDEDGKIHFEPIAQDNENVVYGLTTDGLTASAWCNDIGWALRKIYINCRRGNQCFGGSAYAARNSVFLVTVGPRVDSANIPDPRSASKSPS